MFGQKRRPPYSPPFCAGVFVSVKLCWNCYPHCDCLLIDLAQIIYHKVLALSMREQLQKLLTKKNSRSELTKKKNNYYNAGKTKILRGDDLIAKIQES